MLKESLFAFELQPGMITAQDVYSATGQLLVPVNTQLDVSTINKFRLYNITTVSIYVEEKDIPVEEHSTPTHADRVKASPEFQEFKADYIGKIDHLKNTINDIVIKNGVFPTEELLSQASSLADKSSSGLHIFDILHNMREFDDSTFSHCLNVSLICRVFGQWLNMPKEDIDVLTMAGLFHDIGKLTTPENILMKPGKLSNDEYSIMKTHATEGYNFLKTHKLDSRIKEAALFHHERCDGTGYPLGLKGDRIPPFAKIVAIADVYDAMTAARVYRGPMCPFVVLSYIESEGYTKYDPKFLLPFLGNVVSTYIGTTVRLSNGQTGTVVMINNQSLSRPMIHCDNGEFINLVDRSDLTIEALI